MAYRQRTLFYTNAFYEACLKRDTERAKQIIDNAINEIYGSDDDQPDQQQESSWPCCRSKHASAAQSPLQTLKDIVTSVLGTKTIYVLAEKWIYNAYCFNLLDVLDYIAARIRISLVKVDWDSCWMFACSNGNNEMISRTLYNVNKEQIVSGLSIACNKGHINAFSFICSIHKDLSIHNDLKKKYILCVLDKLMRKKYSLFDIKSIQSVADYY